MRKRELKAEIDRLHDENQRLQTELYLERVRQPVVWTPPVQPYVWHPSYTITCGSNTTEFSLGG